MILSPEESLNHLKAGNERYASGEPGHVRVTPQLLEELYKNGQSPYAVIIGCSDSRVPIEVIFDAGPGEFFVIRTAGNVVCPIEMGSLEYAVMHTKASLIVVLGHRYCGAVAAAVKDEQYSPATGAIIREIRACAPDVIGNDPELIEDLNIKYVISKVTENPYVAKAAAQGLLKIIGAKYSLQTGRVTFFD